MRLSFLDQVRGLIMLFMALDHALYFWSMGRLSNEGMPLILQGQLYFNSVDNPTQLAFILMLLSNICAPSFIFITGYVLKLSVDKRKQEGISEDDISKHLIKRGLILIFLQIVIASPAFNLPSLLNGSTLFSIGTILSMSVLSTIGFSYILFAFLRKFSPLKLIFLSFSFYGLSQLVLPSVAINFSFLPAIIQALINLLILPVPFSDTYLVNNNFPLIPWFFVATLGWFFASLYDPQKDIKHEANRFVWVGISFILIFIILRPLQVGDYLIFSGSWKNFLILSKYPPSPLYFLFYLGYLFLVFSLFINLTTFSKFKILTQTLIILEDFGRTPLLFYNTHLWLYLLIPTMTSNWNFLTLKAGIGVWLLGLIILYPQSHFYLKRREFIHREALN